jgi:hypothetical protein
MNDRVRMSSIEFRWSMFWMGDAMSFRLEKNHGAADAIDCNQVGVNLVHAIAMQNVYIFPLVFTNSAYGSN